MKTVSGKLIGLTDDVVVRWDDVEKKSVAKVNLRGRWAYVKKCKKPSEIEGVAICEKSQNDIPMVVVLGLGDDCGKFHKVTKEEKKLGMTYQVDWPEGSVGMQALCPDNHPWGIKESPWEKDEFFVHECIVKAILG